MKRLSKYSLFTFFIFFFSCTFQNNERPDIPSVTNIIFFIGDGMADTHLYAAMIIQGTPTNIEQFPYAGFQKTSSLTSINTCSAAAATALATGQKTRSLIVGQDTSGNNLESILKIAQAHGLATGLVATSSITHATPAAFYANQPSRRMNEEIAYDLVKTEVDVFIGGGYDAFGKRDDGLNLIDSLKARGYAVTETMDQVRSVTSGRLAGFTAAVDNPKFSEGRGEMLSDATSKAIELLSQNDKGFFLMVEGSMIDWGGHDNDLQYIVDETLDFDRAIGRAIDFARQDGNTLIVITSDHETGGLTLVGGNINIRTVEPHFSSIGHTAGMVPIFSYGPGAERFSGILDNTDFFGHFMDLYGFTSY